MITIEEHPELIDLNRVFMETLEKLLSHGWGDGTVTFTAQGGTITKITNSVEHSHKIDHDSKRFLLNNPNRGRKGPDQS